MLETAEVRHTLDQAAFERTVDELRVKLVLGQYGLHEASAGPVLVLLSGLAGGVRSQTLDRMTSWMDPRFIRALAFGPRTEEERMHPLAWRYWQALPPRGRIGIFMNAWYNEVLDGERVDEPSDIESVLVRIREHEQMLADEGARLVKVWLHMKKRDLDARLDAIADEKALPKRVLREVRERARRYWRRRALAEHVLRETSTACAPWHVVEGYDPNYRDAAIAALVLTALGDAATPTKNPPRAAPTPPHALDNVKLLRDLDLSKRLDEDRYERELVRWQRRLAASVESRRFAKRSLVVVFEGMDAAGKGGAIRRVTAALDARRYTVVPISAPTDEERAHPYLWRFWRQVPRRGGVTIFDRSWYGRVLVERVEGFALEADWLRAYEEINRFEEELTDAGVIVVKLWLHISLREQLARFRARQHTPFKSFKITPDDWRNRRKWTLYEQAVADMVDRTSTANAPWTLVEAEDKRHARVKVLRTIVGQLEDRLGDRD